MEFMPPRSPGEEYVRERLRKLERERAGKGKRSGEELESSFSQRSHDNARQIFLLLVLAVIALVVLLLSFSPGF